MRTDTGTEAAGCEVAGFAEVEDEGPLLESEGCAGITRGAKAVMLAAVPKSRKRDQVLGLSGGLGAHEPSTSEALLHANQHGKRNIWRRSRFGVRRESPLSQGLVRCESSNPFARSGDGRGWK